MSMTYREATLNEIEILADMRIKQLIDEECDPYNDIKQELIDFFKTALQTDSFIQLVAEEHGAIVATGGIEIYQFPPGFDNPSGKKAYISSIYTVPEYRRKGISSGLIRELLEIARKKQIKKVWLNASFMGKPVYTKLGFEGSASYMAIELKESVSMWK